MNTRTGARRPLPGSPFNVPQSEIKPPEQYAVGDRVNHDRFGLGIVVGIEGNSVVAADFGSGTVLRLPLTSTKLAKL